MVECELDPSDPLFAVKLELLETPDSYHNYYLRENFTNADTYCIFSFLRFAVFNEDQAYLILAKSQAIQEAKRQWIAQGRAPE